MVDEILHRKLKTEQQIANKYGNGEGTPVDQEEH